MGERRRGLFRLYGLMGALRECEHVLKHGDEKYEPGDWAEGPRDTEEDLQHAIAHIWEHKRGRALEHESGRPHLAHAIVRLMIALHHEGYRE